MSLTLIPVKVRAVRANGVAVAGARVRAVLTVGESDDGIVVPTNIEGVTDSAGELTLNLWPNSRGVNGSQYRVVIDHGEALYFSGLITVPDAPSTAWPVPMDALINQPPYPAPSVALAAQTAARLSEIAARGYAQTLQDALPTIEAAYANAQIAEAARDFALNYRGVFESTDKALSNGVASYVLLTAGSGGANGTFDGVLTGGGGTGAAFRFTVAGGALVAITPVPGGSGSNYASAPAAGFGASTGLTGATATVVIAPNVGSGQYFGVPSTIVGEALIIYKAVSGVAVEQFRTSSGAALATLTRVVPFVGLPPVGSPLLQTHELVVNDDVDVAALAPLYVRSVFRDSAGPGGAERFQFIVSTKVGSTITDRFGVGASGSSINPAGWTGQKVLPIVAVSGSAVAGYANGQQLGSLRFDFRDGGAFAGSFDLNDSRLYEDKLKFSATLRPVVAAIAADAANATLTRSVPFVNVPPVGSVLLQTHELVVDDGVNLAALAPLYVRSVFRDSAGPGGAERFQFIVSTKVGSTITDRFGVGASGSSINPAGWTGQKVLPIVAVSGSAVAGYANGQQVGSLRFDFRDGGAFSGSFDLNDSRLYLDKLQFSPTLRPVVEAIASAAASAEVAKGGACFVPHLANDFLKGAIKNAWIYGRREDLEPPEFGVTFFEAAVYSSFTRVIIQIGDLRAGQDRCEFSVQVTGRPLVWGQDLPRFVRLTKGNVTNDLHIEAVLELDPDFIAANTSTSPRSWSTVAECGFDPSTVITAEAQAAHRLAPKAGPVLSVGAGGPQATFEACMPALYQFPETGAPGENFAFNVRSARAHYENPVLLRATGYRQSFRPSGDIILPPYVDIDAGCAKLIAPANGERFFEENFSGNYSCADAVVEPASTALSGYHTHCDPVDGTPAAVKRTFKSWWHWNHKLGQYHESWGRGCGLPDGMVESVRASHGTRTNPNTGSAIWGYHTSPNMSVGARLEHASSSDQMRGAAVVVLTSFPSDVINVLDVTGSDHNLVAAGVTWQPTSSTLPRHVGDRNATRIVGRPAYDDCAISYEDPGAIVLKVPEGSVVGGSAAAELFNALDADPTYGAVDKYGLGRWTPIDLSRWSVATRLGNRASSPLALTITLPGESARTYNVAGNYSAMTLAAFVVELNAFFGPNVVSIERYDRWVLPDACRQRRGWNRTGVRMGKGCRVRWVEAPGTSNELRPAADNEPADGFLLTPCAHNDHAIVVIHRGIPAYMLPLVTANGPVYASGGFISSTGTQVIGRCVGDIVKFWS